MDFKPRGRFFFLIIGYKESTSGSPKPSLIPIMGQRLGSPIHPPGISQRPGALSAFQDGARPGTLSKNPISSRSWVSEIGLACSKDFSSPIHPTRDFTAAPGRSPFFKTGHAPGLPAALRSQASQSKFLPVPTPQSLHPQTPSCEWRKGR